MGCVEETPVTLLATEAVPAVVKGPEATLELETIPGAVCLVACEDEEEEEEEEEEEVEEGGAGAYESLKLALSSSVRGEVEVVAVAEVVRGGGVRVWRDE